MFNRIAFLDIDGVINGHEWIHRKEASTWTGARIQTEPSRVLHYLLEKTGANVVLISSWRHWINNGLMTPQGFSRVLLSHGVVAEVVDAIENKDPDLDWGEDRATKIIKWLEINNPGSYVVLENIDLRPFGVKNQIITHPGVGLIESHIDEAVKLFEEQEAVSEIDVSGE